MVANPDACLLPCAKPKSKKITALYCWMPNSLRVKERVGKSRANPLLGKPKDAQCATASSLEVATLDQSQQWLIVGGTMLFSIR